MDANKTWDIIQNMMTGDFNPNHDPENGQFTSGSGGSSAGSENAKSKRLPRGRGHEMIAHSDNLTSEQHSYLQDLEGQAYEFLEERCEENGEDFMDLWGVSEPYEEDGITYVDAEYNVVTKSGKRVDRASQVPVSPKNKKAEPKAAAKPKIPVSSVSVGGEDAYRWTNGRKPKGWGQWNFQIGNKSNMDDWFSFTGNYTEAKKAAKKKAAEMGEWSVKVLA